MTTLVLTVIGDDRAGLVNALADVLADSGANWERCHLAELAGKFAGIVVVRVPTEGVDALVAALHPITGLLDVSIQLGDRTLAEEPGQQELVLELLGNDNPGIVREISAVLSGHGVSIVEMSSDTREAPMAGGQLFEARVTASVPAAVDLAELRDALERLAGELLVDLALDEA